MSNQPRISELQVGRRNAALEHLYLCSLPRLHTLTGFSELPAVRSLFAYDTRLGVPEELPATLTHFRLVTKKVTGRAAHDAQVRAMGLVPDIHLDRHQRRAGASID